MTIRPITDVRDRDLAFTRAYELVVSSKIVKMIDAALLVASGKRTGRPSSSPYRTGPILVVMAMCAHLGMECTYTNMLALLWNLSQSQVTMLGLDGKITARGRMELRDPATARRHHKAFGKAFRRIFSVMDCNPHPQNSRETNAVRHRREAALTKAERAEFARRDALFDEVLNAIIRVSLKDARPDWFRGHTTFDETWLPSRIRTMGRGTRPDKLACPDPTLAWRNDKKTGLPIYVVMLVLASAATMPYERSVLLLITGARVRRPSGESDTDAAVTAVTFHKRNGFGPAGRASARGYADQGYTLKLDLGWRMAELGYVISADAKQPAPRQGFELPEGVFIFNGVFICPAGAHLREHRYLGAFDENKATDVELAKRQELVDEFRRYKMPTNGRPAPYPKSSRLAGYVKVTVICPAAAGQIQCPWVPESLTRRGDRPLAVAPPVEQKPPCKTTFSSIRVRRRDLKHLDLDIRGSFEHADAYNLNRSAMEKVNGFVKRADMNGFNSQDMQPFGRVPMGMFAIFTGAFYNIRTIEEAIAEYGSVNNTPPSPRITIAAVRSRRIKAGRRELDHPTRNRKNNRNTRP